MGNAFDYVAVLVSIIVGLGMTRILTGLSDAIQAGNHARTYWIHTLWMITTLIYLMLFWWVFYRWKATAEWNLFLFIWVTIAPTLIYLASGVLCPGELEKTGSASWRDYYYANRRGFFFILAPLWPLDIIDTLLKGRQHFIDQGYLYLPTMLALFAGHAVAGLTANKRYHAFWAIGFPLYLLLYAAFVLLKLG